jgi:protein-tyrosine phosphatase
MPHVDLHLHLLPGVDDGPADEAGSLEHAERLVRAGVTEAAVTPHVGHWMYPLDVFEIAARTRALQAAVDSAGLGLRLHPGGEIHPGGATALSAAELDAIAHGPPGARWVLLEVPFAGIDDAFLDACRHVREAGFGLLIGHPERAEGFLADGHRMLQPELAAGALLQVNLCSLLGRQGPEAHAGAVRLVRDGAAYIVASDGHGTHRTHTLGEAPAALRTAGASRVRSGQLTAANPRFLLRDGIPRAPAPRGDAPWRSPHRRRVARALAARRGAR